MRDITHIMLTLFVLVLCVVTQTSSYSDYQIKYRVKIMMPSTNKVLLNECLVTSFPRDNFIWKDENDIQYNNLVFIEGSQLCTKPKILFSNATAVLATETALCGLVTQLHNARESNINILLITSKNKIYLPNIKEELAKSPIVILMPLSILDQINKTSLNQSKIGIYGSHGNNITGDILTVSILFGIIVVTMAIIIFLTIFFHKQHLSKLRDVSTSDAKSLKWMLIICPIMMIGLLLLLYYFYNFMVWILIIMFYLACAYVISNLLMLGVDKFDCLPLWILPVKKYGIKNIDFRALGFFIFGLALSTLWIINRNNMIGLVMNNILGVFLCSEIALSLGIVFAISKNFKFLITLLTIILVVDVLMVYIPTFETKVSQLQIEAYIRNDTIVRVRRENGNSIMEKVATGSAGSTVEEVPIRFKILRVITNESLSKQVCQNITKQYSLIGFGDVILPGSFIVFILTYAVSTSRSVALYSIVMFICYFVGLIITDIVVIFAERGQPALVFLIPSTVLPTLLLTYIKKDFMVLWKNEWVLDYRQSIPKEEEEKISIGENDTTENTM